MLTFLFAITAIAVSCGAAQGITNVTDVVKAFNDAKIVPDVLPSFNPMGLLNVVFTDNTTNTTISVTPGMNLTREQTALRPQVSFTTDVAFFVEQTYVLAMVDPDAPTPQNPTSAQIRHLLAPNITVNGSLSQGALLVNNTPAISDFLRPTPPAGSDPHRYILLLFVQPTDFTAVVPGILNSSTPVSNFNISAFAEQTGLGSPIAGNFFLTGPDSANSTSSGNPTSTASGSSSTPTSPAATGPASDTGATGGNSALGGPELNLAEMSLAMSLLGMLLL